MIRFLQKTAAAIDLVNEYFGRAVAWLNVFLIVLICYDVLMRKLFRVSSIAIFELEWHLFALIFLLAAGYTLKHDRHVRVDVFYSRFSPRLKAWVNLVGTSLFLIPLCLITIRSGWLFTRFAYLINEGSPDPGGLPGRFLIKSAILIGFVFLAIQAVSICIHSILIIMGKETSPPPEHISV